ncbi:16S rRNA m(4)C1402 methyltransferase [Oceaniovalibus guishaninsula JLT2003]|uniref:Ribosomal RNA small subunit methyltransferase H n=1 Tax=Oceaniovalibus guishaninsula JLT2003 TaxID=1231392 RepID=K2HFR1_9RHOB|nr:16S rRNA (cytosine(1402)-N(4))-methyltransferase RsmH [Oceaniovalibus guishaninsula]EKE45332.1 16S rRNA m(4)C1402 methyltransferase [Oceaniovalibus guishaninsula JLT2003]
MTAHAPHVPVLLGPILTRCAPIRGHWIDGTLGAGGYARGLLDAGATRVTGIDRDPTVFAIAADRVGRHSARLRMVEGTFSDLDTLADGPADGVVLDLGVSSMQLDQAERGFSFLRDGPLDMRMGADGPTAADIVNSADEGELADLLYHYGEERASRRIARAIVADRPFTRTTQLAALIERVLPRRKPGQSHPATRSFQALRIAVNDEFGQLVAGLEAAERALQPGGWLAVVSFHSMEDRVVKRFLADRGGARAQSSRHAPASEGEQARFTDVSGGIAADADEVAANPRARSARLRIARRTDTEAGPVDRTRLGLPPDIRKTR